MRCFTDTTIFTDVGCITTSQLTSQRLYTLLTPISHVASSPRHLSHSPDLCFHIYHHSLVCFACLSAEDCGTPWTVTLRSLRSHRSHIYRTAFGFWVLLLCTALTRRLSAYHKYFYIHKHLSSMRRAFYTNNIPISTVMSYWISANISSIPVCSRLVSKSATTIITRYM